MSGVIRVVITYLFIGNWLEIKIIRTSDIEKHGL